MTRPTFGTRPQRGDPVAPTPPATIPTIRGTVRVPVLPAGTALGSGYSIQMGRVVDWDAIWPTVEVRT